MEIGRFGRNADKLARARTLAAIACSVPNVEYPAIWMPMLIPVMASVLQHAGNLHSRAAVVRIPRMSKRVEKASRSQHREHAGRHRFEHWLADNQVYFITARCRDQYSAFTVEATKAIFWQQFDKYAAEFGFTPWVTSLVDNHYHTLGYLRIGRNLPTMMQRLHGSVAKLVNDLLPARHLPFWRDAEGKSYFDGCIRDEKQAWLAYRYTLTQSVRHGIVLDWRDYPHTHVKVELELAIRRSHELRAFLEGVPYKRYQRPK